MRVALRIRVWLAGRDGVCRRRLERVRSEHRLGELEQRGGGAGWTKREHVFVKVTGVADGPARAPKRRGRVARKARSSGEIALRGLQRILQR